MRPATLTGWHFAWPELAEYHLRAFDLGLISATALHARRRMGKTEFLMEDLSPAAHKRGYVVGYCNLWQEDQNPADAIAGAAGAGAARPRRLALRGTHSAFPGPARADNHVIPGHPVV